MRRVPRLALFGALLAAAAAIPAAAQAASSGGTSYAEPVVSALKCGTGEQASCPRGAVLRLSGENLAGTTTVIFLGARGPRDDTSARPQTASAHRVIVTVPASARSGRLRVVAARAQAAGPRLLVLPLPATPAPALPLALPLLAAFPILGAHDYGTAINRFGGARRHQGQDVLAACGTPLVAAVPGAVTLTRFEQRAGNYVVITADNGTSQVYMHLLAPATVVKGQRVDAGQPLGQVGQTGDATTCHLHFELWTAPGWQAGGQAVDPMAFLKAVDTAH